MVIYLNYTPSPNICLFTPPHQLRTPPLQPPPHLIEPVLTPIFGLNPINPPWD